MQKHKYEKSVLSRTRWRVEGIGGACGPLPSFITNGKPPGPQCIGCPWAAGEQRRRTGVARDGRKAKHSSPQRHCAAHLQHLRGAVRVSCARAPTGISCQLRRSAEVAVWDSTPSTLSKRRGRTCTTARMSRRSAGMTDAPHAAAAAASHTCRSERLAACNAQCNTCNAVQRRGWMDH